MGWGTERRRLVVVSLAAIMAAGISGCALNGFGGGTIPSAGGGAGYHAVFSVNYQITGGDPSTGNGTGILRGVYLDSHVPGRAVKLKFNGLTMGRGPSFGANQCFAGTGNYVSLDPANPGTGKVSVIGCDNGRAGAPSHDTLTITVLSGPFAGYKNGPSPVTGNLITR